MLLQNQLQRMSKTQKKKVNKTGADKQTVQKSAIDRVQTIFSDDELSDDVIHRTLVSGILTEEFGSKVANDPAFQNMVDKIVGELKLSEKAMSLLDQAVDQIKGP